MWKMKRTPLVTLLLLSLCLSILFGATTVAGKPAEDASSATFAANLDENPLPPPRPSSAESSHHPAVRTLAPAEPDTDPSVTPTRIVETLSPGESYTGSVEVFSGDVPVGKGDIMFLFDRTGSMGDEIDEAKNSATGIMNAVRAELPNSWFGLASFMDYPDAYSYPDYSATYGSSAYGDVPWELNIQPTENITDVSNSINALWLGWGADGPESYTRALYEIQSVAWRANSKKIVVLFGDAPTHDLDFAGYNYGGDPGRDAIAQTDDDLDFETIVQQLRDEGVSVIAVNSGSTAAAEATFLGASTGYSGAVGTNGQYFQLASASQIPEAVVDLIREETENLDILSLEVTEGYEDWLEVDPIEHTDVLSNTTRNFDITITVPEGTESGFYPFLIQAVGDGSILGVTYVEITVPADDPISDTGFRPSSDGFRFNNRDSTLTWEMFRQFFGTDQVEHSNGNRVHAADQFFLQHYSQAGDGGTCDGFVSTSLLNYEGLDQPNAGEFAMQPLNNLHSHNETDDMRDALAFNQGVQLGLEINYHRSVMCQALNNSPRGFYNYLKSLIENGSGAILSIRWDRDYRSLGVRVLEAGGGHALLPYRFEEPSADEAYVYVYDPNREGDDDRRVEFDFTNDSWTYDFHIPLWPDVEIGGDATSCLLGVKPIEMYRHQGVPFWQVVGFSSNPLSDEDGVGTHVYSTSGPAKLLIIDDEGRRLGWDGSAFYDEIPDAYYTSVDQAEGSDEPGFYFIPPTHLYDVEVYGYGVGTANVSLWREGSLFSLENMSVMTGTVSALSLAEDGNGFTVSSIVSDTVASLSHSTIFAGEDQTFTVGGLALTPGEEATIQRTGTITSPFTMQLDGLESKEVSLSLRRGGGAGYAVFGASAMTLTEGANAHVDVTSWSDLDEVAVQVDYDRDGTVDDIRILQNESLLGTITISPERSVIYAGGQEVEIGVGVRDQFGAYVADGQEVTFGTTLGTLSEESALTAGGRVATILTTGSEWGTATISVQVGDVVERVEIEIRPYTTFLPALANQ